MVSPYQTKIKPNRYGKDGMRQESLNMRYFHIGFIEWFAVCLPVKTTICNYTTMICSHIQEQAQQNQLLCLLTV